MKLALPWRYRSAGAKPPRSRRLSPLAPTPAESLACTSFRPGPRIALTIGILVVLTACSAHPEIDSWVLLEPDDKTIHFGVDTCNADLEAAVIELGTQVEVTITAKNDTTDACRDQLVVTIDNPLGERGLVDGSTGETLEVRRLES